MYNFVFSGEQLLFRTRLKKCTGKDLERVVRRLLQYLESYIPYLHQVLNAGHAEKYAAYFRAACSVLKEIVSRKLLICLTSYIDTGSGSGPNICPNHGITSILAGIPI